MRLGAYVYGLACLSLGIGLASYFASIFLLQSVVRFVPVSAEKMVVHIFVAIPFVIAFSYFVSRAWKVKKHGIPEAFKGWRYLFTILGFAALMVGMILTIVWLTSAATTGGQSGIPFGLGMGASMILAIPAMIMRKK